MPYQVIEAAMVLAQSDGEQPSGLGSLIFFLVIGAAVYFLFFGPQRRRMKAMRAEAEEMRSSLEFGDEIVTVGGIYGRITGTTDSDVTIDVGGGTELRIARRAVAERIGDDTE